MESNHRRYINNTIITSIFHDESYAPYLVRNKDGSMYNVRGAFWEAVSLGHGSAFANTEAEAIEMMQNLIDNT